MEPAYYTVETINGDYVHILALPGDGVDQHRPLDVRAAEDFCFCLFCHIC